VHVISPQQTRVCAAELEMQDIKSPGINSVTTMTDKTDKR